jgi:flagellin-like protein
MADPERKVLDRTFEAPPVPGHAPWWSRGLTPLITAVVLVAFVLSLVTPTLVP